MSTSGPQARKLEDEDYQRLLAFRTELRDFLRWSEQAAHDGGLTSSLHQLLLVVRGHPSESGPTMPQRTSISAITASLSWPNERKAQACSSVYETRSTTGACTSDSPTTDGSDWRRSRAPTLPESRRWRLYLSR